MIRKSVFCLVLFAALVAAPSSVFALDFSLYGSAWDTDELQESFGLGGRVGFPVAENLAVQLSVHYFDKFDNHFESVESPEIEVETIPIDVSATWYFGEEQSGFLVGGGLSYTYMDVSNIRVQDMGVLTHFRGEADDEFGWHVKVGYQLPAGFLAEVMYRDMEVTVDDIQFVSGNVAVNLPVKANIDMSGYQINLGWRF